TTTTTLLLALLAPLTAAISLNAADAASIKAAADTAAKGIISSYTFGAAGTAEYLVGTWPKPIYWWEAGAVWGGLVDYWAYTGDAQYNQLIQRAFEAQAGPENSFTRDEWRKEFGNDDQAFWALSALSAAEQSFPALSNPSHGYATLAANVFDAQIARWDTSSCNGGLRWQVYPENKGYNYKNTVSASALFQVAARLALHNNDAAGTYAIWAAKLWDWSVGVGFVDRANSYAVYDGANVGTNCTDIDLVQWTYNNALYLYGAAAMYNLTASSDPAKAGRWKERVDTLVSHAARSFFNRPGIPLAQHGDAMYEAACESNGMCNTDQMSFKAYLSRWLAKTTVIVPDTLDTIKPLITASANGAADACKGPGQLNCGFRWNTGNFDGTSGLGPQLAALEVFDALLLVNRQALTIKGGVTVPSRPTTTSTTLTSSTTTTSSSSSTSSTSSTSSLSTSTFLGSASTSSSSSSSSSTASSSSSSTTSLSSLRSTSSSSQPRFTFAPTSAPAATAVPTTLRTSTVMGADMSAALIAIIKAIGAAEQRVSATV
ncbi:glycosyl hydrolase family 76-domain-containing protein, partial [Phyllosticta paracitricarpa]